MNANFLKLYTADSSVESAYFLHDGKIYFYVSNADKYALSGKNLIVGATEVIMNRALGLESRRIETALVDKNSDIKRMSSEKIMDGLKSYSVSLNISIVLAQQVLLTNKIINQNLNLLEGDEKTIRELSLEHYRLVHGMQQEYEKRKLPWLKEIIQKHETTLTYKRGEAFHKSSEPLRITATKNLSDKMVEYERGAVICEENTAGDEMFILESGAIDVIINGNKVTSIEESGTVIGEMALLLGEKRTATLKAKNNVVVTKIAKTELREVAEKQHEVLYGVAVALAKKHYYNIMKIGNINRSLVEHSLSEEERGDKKASQIEKIKKELSSLKNDIEGAVSSKDADFLSNVMTEKKNAG